MSEAAPSTSPDSPCRSTSTATAVQSSVNSAAKSRRIPPQCWFPDEIAALIRTYRDKWVSLHRGNLRANHWQEVADEIGVKFPVTPPKTPVQCRHKMEKLRKRYRGEIQRAVAKHGGLGRYSSPWVHFSLMHEMETKGSKANNFKNPPPPASSSSDDEYGDNAYGCKGSMKRINGRYSSHENRLNSDGIPTAIPLRIPGRVIPGPPMGQFDVMNHKPNPYPYLYPNPNFTVNHSQFGNFGPVDNGGAGSSKVFRNGFSAKKVTGEVHKKRKVTNGDGMNSIVEAVQALGEGFMRVEKAKMDMVRHVEEMRMELELKRTEMLLESQQRIIEAFADAVTKRKNRAKKKNQQ